jgi:hypothetical protein
MESGLSRGAYCQPESAGNIESGRTRERGDVPLETPSFRH